MVVYYAAMSLDGYIARRDGSVDWLSAGELGVPEADAMGGYDRFYATVDTLVMGRATYDQVLGFGEWPYAGKPCYVFTRREHAADPNVEFVDGDPAAVLRQIEARTAGLVWLVGGGDLARQFHEADLIDEWRVTVIPRILGSGIPLIGSALREQPLRLAGVEQHAGLVELRYRRRA